MQKPVVISHWIGYNPNKHDGLIIFLVIFMYWSGSVICTCAAYYEGYVATVPTTGFVSDMSK